MHRNITYYRTAAGAEIDFVIETRQRRPEQPPHVVCVEVKLSPRWDRRWERPMRDLQSRAGIRVDGMYGVYTAERSYRFDGVDVWPVEEFLEKLHQGKIF